MNKEDILNKVLQDICVIQKDKKFIRDVVSGYDYTFGQFFSIAGRIGIQLESKYKELVVCKENGFKLCTLLFACLIKNITVIPIDPRKEQKEIQEVLKNHPDAKWVIDKEKDNFQDDFDYSISDNESFSIKELLETVNYHKDYLITYTSGTTGIAKGVIHSAGSLLVNAYIFGNTLGLKECCLAHIMPMTYMAGILNSLILPFVMGGQIVLFPRFDIKTMGFFWKNIDKFSINTIWMSPTMLNMICRLDKNASKENYIRNNNVTFCVGTAPLSHNVKEKFEQLFHTRIYQSYGLTELLLITTELPETDHNCSSVGKPLKGVRLKLEENELLIKVPWSFKGYTNENSEKCFSKEYYRSGDLAKIENGNLFIYGRKKDLIIKGGIKINPQEIEKVINHISGVIECKIDSIVVDDEEKICCYLVSKDFYIQCVERIKQTIADELGSLYKIDYFIQMKELPKNLNGKIDSKKLKRYAANVIKIGYKEL